MGGDDVLNSRTVLRLLQPQGADQDPLLGIEAATPFSSASCLLAAFSDLRMSGRSKRAGAKLVRGGISVIAVRLAADVYRKAVFCIRVLVNM